MSEASEAQAQARLRRNGKQQSCEACRLRKQSCSHETPCSRCVRHSRNCIYVHAPMSRLAKADSTARSISPRAIAPSSTPASVPKAAPLARVASSHVNPLTFATGGDLGYKRTPYALSLSYVGSTGYSAIFDEAKGHLGMNIWDDPDGNDHGSTIPFLRARADGSRPGIDFCQRILAWLPSREICIKAVAWNMREYFVCAHDWPTMIVWHDSFWEAYDDVLLEPRNEKKLNGMIEEVVRNTTKPLPTRPATNKVWQDALTGRKTRWDLIGQLFIVLGAAALTMPDSEPLLHEILPPELKSKKKSFGCSMLECADACLLICEELDPSSNIHIVALLARCVILQSVVEGDSSFDLWRRCGRLAAAVTGLGLHLKMENPEQIAPWYHECRTRTYLMAYNMSVGLASFTGRPALLSRRYMTLPLPLDVSDEALIAAESWADLRKTTDEDGWDLEGKLHPATDVRAFMLAALQRDEVLDMTLTQSSGNLTERIRDLRTRMEATRKKMPMLYQLPLDKKAFSEKSVNELSSMAQLRLTSLHSIFLIERLEHEEKDEQRLLKVAKEMLNLVVTYWSERDRFPSHRDEVHWFISSAGIPAASALAIDLFKQTTSPYLKPASPQRPDIIQDLSLFVACLDWLRPEDGNYVLCGRVRKMIKHILDRVLTPSVPTLQDQDFSNYNLNDISIDSLPQFGMEFGGWLDGIDAAGIGLDWTDGIMQY